MEEKVNLPKPIKVEIEPDEVKYETYPIKKGMIRIHPGHGKNEKRENLEVASYLANKYGYEIELLDNPQGVSSADSFNYTLDVKQEYKVSKTPTKNSIDRLIREGKNQADHIVLRIDCDIALGDLRDAVTSRIKRSLNIKKLTIIRHGKDVTYNWEDIIKEDFKIKQEDFK